MEYIDYIDILHGMAGLGVGLLFLFAILISSN